MLIICFLYAYLFLGFLFAIWFAFINPGKGEFGIRHTSLWFRLIIIPGSIVLWPVMLIKIYIS
ncbi:hypothetical protein RG47T_3534 [Mucilaginibacter polytrichastri]|uniref:Cardiolipin synthase N-terminal domain-containing protein n=1 Tax=Mucilaginibacter polytrichastri TaxID=1302689 RepID=A0A1Q6A235_9SPHI|nr:hypothetical protein RG47T_3534 [Mucilaginibacter polytrichastri]